jgi:hypothetical protein
MVQCLKKTFFSKPEMSLVVCLQCPIALSEDNKYSLASYVFSLSKTPGIKFIVVFGVSCSILDKIPRSLRVILKPSSSNFYEEVVDTCKEENVAVTDLVMLISDLKDLVVPEAMQCSALALRKCDYAFLRETTTQQLIKVEFMDARHWMMGVPAQKNFMTKFSTLIQDIDDLKGLHAQNDFAFDVLTIMKQRILASPLPSLACPLPLSIAMPPIVPWKQVHELIKNFI